MAKKILLIEDDPQQIAIYEKAVKEAGFEIESLKWGEEGLKRLEEIKSKKKEKPDLILLDLMLPRKSGFDILKEIKADPKVKDIPVIILSNLAQEKEIEQGLALGAVDYLVKTDYSIQQVMEKIKKALERSQNN